MMLEINQVCFTQPSLLLLCCALLCSNIAVNTNAPKYINKGEICALLEWLFTCVVGGFKSNNFNALH